MKTIALYGLQMLVGLVALAAGYAKLTGMGFMAEPFAMIGLGKTFLMIAGTAEILAGLCLLFPRSGVIGAVLLATVMVGTMGASLGHVDQPPRRCRAAHRVADLPHRRAAGRDGEAGRDQEEPRLGYLSLEFPRFRTSRILAKPEAKPPVFASAVFLASTPSAPLYSRPSHTRTLAQRRPVLRSISIDSGLMGPRRNNRRRHMALPDYSMRQLLEAGVHFGHQSHRWNPKMAEYIFGARNNIHILDLAQTVPMMHRALQAVSDTVAKGGRILFVGTKRQAQDAIADAAKRSRAVLRQFALARRHADQLEDDLGLDQAAAPARGDARARRKRRPATPRRSA